MRRKLLFAAAFLVLVFILTYPMVSKAVNGQSYSGDGATYNSSVPPGGWLYTQATDGSCLTCHGTGFTNAPIKTNYLMTGHRNAIRMVPAFALTNPSGQPYGADLFGDLFSWTDSTITLRGFCTISFYTDPANCANGGGVWLSGSKPLYYLYGGWMSAAPGALYDGSYAQGGQKTAVSYSCGRCHTTGFTMDTTIRGCSFVPPTSFVCRTPETFFPGVTWTPSNTTGKIDLDPDGNGPAITSSWAVVLASGQSLEGIQCERCHNATNGHTPAIIQKGPAATALCLQCHRQEHVVTYTTGSMGANIHPTPATDNASLPVSEPRYALPAIEVGRSDGSYAPVFYEYSTGMEYLNSVHGQFTGNFPQINDPSKYLSSFVTSSVDGGCTKCHDVHESTVAAVNAPAPFKRICPDCHQEGSALGLSKIYHPSGPGTPLGDLTNIPAACAKCHMPKPNNGEGRSSHIWRISTDASYTTFPSQTQWDAGQKTALTDSRGTYTNAVWIDIDLACGQCHGAAGSAHLMTKAGIVPSAASMHTSSGAPTTVCMGCHNTVQNSNPAIVVSGNHHGAVPGRTKECIECHTRPGTIPANWQTDGYCRTCHYATPGPYQVMNAQHPKTAMTPASCSTCHFAGGFVPDPANDLTCAQCHGGGTSPSSLAAGGTVITTAPWLSSAGLANVGLIIHTDPSATTIPPVVSHGAVTLTGWQVSFAETSYDPDGTIDAVTVNWGDGVVSQGTVSSGTFSHDYSRLWTQNADGTFTDAGANPNPRPRSVTITHVVVDKIRSSITAQETFTVNVPQRYTVAGIVTTSTGTPLSGAIVSLKLNGSTLKSATTAGPGTFNFTNLLPGGVFTVQVYKSGYTFNVFTINSLTTDVTAAMTAN